MNVHKARAFAEDNIREYLTETGREGWTFEFDRATSVFGKCWYNKKLITLSFEMTVFNFDEEVKDTILHEIAHAVAGHDAGHGEQWRIACIMVGAKPKRCYSLQTVANRHHRVSEKFAARMAEEE